MKHAMLPASLENNPPLNSMPSLAIAAFLSAPLQHSQTPQKCCSPISFILLSLSSPLQSSFHTLLFTKMGLVRVPNDPYITEALWWQRDPCGWSRANQGSEAENEHRSVTGILLIQRLENNRFHFQSSATGNGDAGWVLRREVK